SKDKLDTEADYWKNNPKGNDIYAYEPDGNNRVGSEGGFEFTKNKNGDYTWKTQDDRYVTGDKDALLAEQDYWKNNPKKDEETKDE
ncbi:hypothetical protein HLB44_36550, partial [Aquincola sp. S2]